VAACANAAAALEVQSPNGQLVLTFVLKDLGGKKACPHYRLDYKGKTVLADSRLGLELVGGPLSEGLALVRQTRTHHDTRWRPVCGERETIRDRYQQVVVDLQESKAPRRVVRLTVRAYDEGVAFCYTLPAQEGLKDFTIASETTGFRFTADHTAWAVYTAQGNYANAAVPLSRIKPGAERPLTVRVADDLYAAVTEARSVDYARMKLRPVADQPHALKAFLDGERGRAGVVTGTTPFTTPWRVILVADSPGGLLEQDDLILNLNDPCALTDTSWIKPGKVIRETTLTTAGSKACVDFAVERGLQFVEYDAGWYGPEADPKSDARAVDPRRAGRLNLREVIAYANARGIGVILYVNQRALARQLDEILPLYRKWGVKGLKFGFVNVGSQRWTGWLHDAIRKAAAHQLMVDIHDEFRSTGFQRTYPNLMTVEGILGNEGFPPPAHNAALPFTRFPTGPGDYTFCWYDKRLETSHAHQLALSTICFSPWQFLFWYDKPSAYRGDKALEYWKHLPTVWDDTRVLQGEIGRYASVARRKGPAWYVGTIHADGRGLMKLPLSFLEPGRKYRATIYRDRDPGEPHSKAVKIETITVDSGTVIKADIPPNGGHAMHIVPASPRE
jgi:alpha-glucosidase